MSQRLIVCGINKAGGSRRAREGVVCVDGGVVQSAAAPKVPADVTRNLNIIAVGLAHPRPALPAVLDKADSLGRPAISGRLRGHLLV